MVVAGVGSFVDWKKELAFVQSRHKSDAKNVVSNRSFSQCTRVTHVTF
jgi:hypothetical protein